MIPLLTGAEMRDIDRQLVESLKIPSLKLMESAGKGAFSFLKRTGVNLKKSRVLILCGKGNNGGDGLVVARYLKKSGVTVEVVSISPAGEFSHDAMVMAKKYEKVGGKILFCQNVNSLKTFLQYADVIVDALLGTGTTYSSSVSGAYKEWIKAINETNRPVFALDLPSGLSADTGRPLGVAVQARWTATMGFMKVGLAVSPGCMYAGKVEVIDIGIPRKLRESVESRAGGLKNRLSDDGLVPSFANDSEGQDPPRRYLVDNKGIKLVLKRRAPDGHKGAYGHVMIVAGSPTKLGAALMAGKGSLRTGSGLVTLVVPEAAYKKIPSEFLELMYEPVRSARDGTFSASSVGKIRRLWSGKSVVAVGPGMGVSPSTKKLVCDIICSSPVPVILDADGINVLQGRLNVLRSARSEIVLTPHPGEMARLLGIPIGKVQDDRLNVAVNFATKYRVTVVLKGYRTIIATRDGRAFVNSTGDSALATAGMGDVLTGMIASLISQGIDIVSAATTAVYLHGLAGDMLSEKMGDRGILAGDLVDFIPYVIKRFVTPPLRTPS